jgi:hypothetical protein
MTHWLLKLVVMINPRHAWVINLRQRVAFNVHWGCMHCTELSDPSGDEVWLGLCSSRDALRRIWRLSSSCLCSCLHHSQSDC